MKKIEPDKPGQNNSELFLQSGKEVLLFFGYEAVRIHHEFQKSLYNVIVYTSFFGNYFINGFIFRKIGSETFTAWQDSS